MSSQGLRDIPVFYSEHMLAETHSFSPSASKPRHVLAAWQEAGLPIACSPSRRPPSSTCAWHTMRSMWAASWKAGFRMALAIPRRRLPARCPTRPAL